MQIKIEKALFGGFGLGKINNKSILVNYAIPGDVAEITITDSRKDFDFAEITDIIEPSTQRVTPLCPNFYRCGGCNYLHVEYTHELELKKSILLDTLSRCGKISIEPDFCKIIHSNRYNYRSHTRIQSNELGQAGFYEANSNKIIPFPAEGCLLLAEPIVKYLQQNTLSKNSADIKIAIDENSKIFCSENDNQQFIESVNNIKYERNLDSFFQSNLFNRKLMLDEVAALLPDKNVSIDQTFLDVGCGIGFFTIAVAPFFKSGQGIDVSSNAINYARKNSRLNNVDNIDFKKITADKINTLSIKPDLIIVDPPRSGLSKSALEGIINLNPESVIYVSCNPSTFARDASGLIRHGYKLDKLSMIDMFPGTQHIEVISRFYR